MRDPRRLNASYRSATDGYLRAAAPVVPADPTGAADSLVGASLTALRRRVRSPLEALFGVRLIEALARRGAVGVDRRDTAAAAGGAPVRTVELCCNLRVDRMEFDFWIRSRQKDVFQTIVRTTLVECDGAAWHWGRQLDRDRRKDEFASELDWCMFRLPSRTILRDPADVADEVVDYALEGYLRVGGLLLSREEFRVHCSET